MKILVIQQKMIGDVLTSTIICEALRKKHPNATIHYLINSSTKPVVEKNPFFDTIIEFKNEYRDSKKALYRFLKTIQKSKYDLVIDAYGKLESNLISYFSKAPTKISFYKWYTHFLYTETIKRHPQPTTNASAAIENRLRLVYSEDEITSNILRPKIFLNDDEISSSKVYLESNGINTNKPLLMISVLGSEMRKTLPLQHMAEIIDKIASVTNATILFNYLPHQRDDAKSIYDMTNQDTQELILFDVFGKNLREFITILHHCDALIGNEGGAVNMAKALGKPTFTFFSPWIIKKDWNMFEDGILQDSIHLIDCKPELYGDKSPKEMKNKALELYESFVPEMIIPKLTSYLKNLKF